MTPMDIAGLAPLDNELTVEPTSEPPTLAEAISERDEAVEARQATVRVRELAQEALTAVRNDVATVASAGPIQRKLRGITKAKSAAVNKAVTQAEMEVADALAAERAADRVLDAAQTALVDAAHRHYEAMVQDKRTGFDAIACSRWYADTEGDAEHCHCHEVPGNTLPEDFVPHHAGNYKGRPWCIVHQGSDCEVPHQPVMLEQFLRRFQL